jgi:hypothetical protein
MSFEEILASCLDALAAGHTIEACLANYPDVADELEPLLRVAFVLDETAFPAMSDSGFERGRAAVRTAAQTWRLEESTPNIQAAPLVTGSVIAPRGDAHLYALKPAPTKAARSRWRWPLGLASVATASALVALLLFSQASSIVPGNWLYPVKRLGEQAQGVLLAAAGEDATWQARLVARRVGELHTLHDQGASIDPAWLEAVVIDAESALSSSVQLDAPQRSAALETLHASLDEAVAVIPPEAEALRARMDDVAAAAEGGAVVALQATPMAPATATPLPQPTEPAPTPTLFIPTPTWTPPVTLAPAATPEQLGRPRDSAAPAEQPVVIPPTPTPVAPVLVFVPPTPPSGGELAAALDGDPALTAVATVEGEVPAHIAAAGEISATLLPTAPLITPDPGEAGVTITEPILIPALPLTPTLALDLALTATPTVTPTLTLTPALTITPGAPLLPTPTFTALPAEPTTAPVVDSTGTPELEPTEPASTPELAPTAAPTLEPTATPTAALLPTPTVAPTATPDSPVPTPTAHSPPTESPPEATPLPTEPPEPEPTSTPTVTLTPTNTPLPPPTATAPIPTQTTPGDLPAPAPPL